MKLKDFLEVLAVGMPFTVGTENGTGWVTMTERTKQIFLTIFLRDKLTQFIQEKEGKKCRLAAN